MLPNCADSINTVDVNLTGHWSILKYHEFTKKRIICMYFVFVHVCMHISKSFLYFVSLSNLLEIH